MLAGQLQVTDSGYRKGKMKKLSVLICLCAWSAAYADLREVAWEGDRAIYGSIKVFVDYSSIQRIGDTAKISWLLDEPRSSNVKAWISNRRVLFVYYSTTWSSEVNCSKSQIRHLTHTYHSAQMGKGSSYANPRPADWMDVKQWYPYVRAVAAVACSG